MKKILFSFLLAIMATMSVGAETALQEQKFFDNWYIGINGGVTTPLSLENITPLNPTVGLRLGKDFTPVFGVNFEGTTWLGSHTDWANMPRFDWNKSFVGQLDDMAHFAFRSVNTGVNATVNLSNLFGGYKGKPRVFEVTTVTGIGWWHTFVKDGEDYDDLSAKTALDLTFNIGGNKAHAFYIEPGIYWNLSYWSDRAHSRKIEFNKNYAQLALAVGYNYKFKTSNGTHNFKIVDFADRDAEIQALNDEVNALRARQPEVVEKIVERIVEVPIKTDASEYIVAFAKGSYDLTNDAKEILNKIPKGTKVSVTATASPDGNKAFNDQLSQARADNVSMYLINRGVNVLDSKGVGVTGEDSQRIAKVVIK